MATKKAQECHILRELGTVGVRPCPYPDTAPGVSAGSERPVQWGVRECCSACQWGGVGAGAKEGQVASAVDTIQHRGLRQTLGRAHPRPNPYSPVSMAAQPWPICFTFDPLILLICRTENREAASCSYCEEDVSRWAEGCVPSKSTCWSPDPHCDGIWGWDL